MLNVPRVVLGAATKPVSLLVGVEQLVEQLAQVAARSLALLDVAEPLGPRVAAVVDQAEAVTARVEQTVASVQPLAQGAAALDPQALVALVAALPAVLDRLATQVDSLERTVADVGTLLHSIPGAARLAKRGTALTAR